MQKLFTFAASDKMMYLIYRSFMHIFKSLKLSLIYFLIKNIHAQVIHLCRIWQNDLLDK